MNPDLSELKKQRAEIKGQIAALEGQWNALYMPGITMVRQQGRVPPRLTSNWNSCGPLWWRLKVKSLPPSKAR